MFFNKVYYHLTCTDCNSEKPNGTTTVFTKNNPKEFTRSELISEMNSFSGIECENCGETGKWTINSLDFKGKVKVLKEFKLNHNYPKVSF